MCCCTPGGYVSPAAVPPPGHAPDFGGFVRPALPGCGSVRHTQTSHDFQCDTLIMLLLLVSLSISEQRYELTWTYLTEKVGINDVGNGNRRIRRRNHFLFGNDFLQLTAASVPRIRIRD